MVHTLIDVAAPKKTKKEDLKSSQIDQRCMKGSEKKPQENSKMPFKDDFKKYLQT